MRSMIKLADNPLAKADSDAEEEETKVNNATSRVDKGPRIRGSRMKLSADARMDRVENAVVSIAKMLRNSLDKDGMYRADDEFGDEFGDDPAAVNEPMEYNEEDDPMAVGDIDGPGEDELMLGDMDGYLSSDFDPYGGEEDKPERSEEDTKSWTPEDVPGISHEGDATHKSRVNRSRAARSRLAKDDTASNFGEKDSDIPGNRQLDPDNKNKDAGEYLIQGGPSDGQAAFNKAVETEVRKSLHRLGLGARVATTGAPGSKVNKAVSQPNPSELMGQLKSLPFSKINALRVQVGDLPVRPGV